PGREEQDPALAAAGGGIGQAIAAAGRHGDRAADSADRTGRTVARNSGILIDGGRRGASIFHPPSSILVFNAARWPRRRVGRRGDGDVRGTPLDGNHAGRDDSAGRDGCDCGGGGGRRNVWAGQSLGESKTNGTVS